MANDHADAVVVGGGVVGTAVAYYLARAGVEVALLEQNDVATGSTGHGHGVISLIGRDFKQGAHFNLGLASSTAYPGHVGAVMEDSGLDPLYHELPGLSVALLEEEELLFRESLRAVDSVVDASWLSGDECREREPRLSEHVRGGVAYTHAQVDARALTRAHVRAVQHFGGRLIHDRVTGVNASAGRVTAVKTTHGRIHTGNVVFATGAWLRAAEQWLGLKLPVRPLHGEVLHMRIKGGPLELFIITARHGPILPRRDGVLMVGSIGGVTMSGAEVETLHSFDPDDPAEVEFDATPQAANRRYMLDKASAVLPILAESTVIDHLAGFRPLAADRMPLIGSVPGLDGAFIAGGHGTKGIHLAPVTGRAIEGMVVGAHSSSIPELAAFAPERFSLDQPA